MLRSGFVELLSSFGSLIVRRGSEDSVSRVFRLLRFSAIFAFCLFIGFIDAILGLARSEEVTLNVSCVLEPKYLGLLAA